jgi:hypothetical protein
MTRAEVSQAKQALEDAAKRQMEKMVKPKNDA